MKLYILKRPEDDVYHDENAGFVVRAPSPHRARKLATEMGGDEVISRLDAATGKREVNSPWEDTKKSTCKVLKEDGPEGVVLEDFMAG